MIRKYLLCGKKQLSLQGRNIEALGEMGRVVELLLPIKEFWAIESDIKRLDYLVATDSQAVDISTQYIKTLKRSLRYSVKAADREWLYQLNRPKPPEDEPRRRAKAAK